MDAIELLKKIKENDIKFYMRNRTFSLDKNIREEIEQVLNNAQNTTHNSSLTKSCDNCFYGKRWDSLCDSCKPRHIYWVKA